MKIQSRFILSRAFLIVGLLMVAGFVTAQETNLLLHIDDVMTSQELKETGVSNLTLTQRKALNVWLTRYTLNVMKLANNQNVNHAAPSGPSARGDCVPAIESTLVGDFNGWEGETIFKLDNGQIWEQAEYDYTYSYAYRPDVTIYQTSRGCRMKVEDEPETILVRRIR